MKRLAVLALVSAMLAASAAAQQDADGSVDVTWRAFTTPNGCVFYEGDLLNMVPNAPKATATWSGACKPGEAITGSGSLTLKRVVNGYNTTRVYKGPVKGGYLDGQITITDTYASLTTKSDKGGSPVHTFTYRMGCMVLSGTNGALESGSIGNQSVLCRAKTANIPPVGAQ